MKEILFLLLLWLSVDSNYGLYNFLGKMPAESMSYQRCAIPFFGKDVAAQLKMSLAHLLTLKERFEVKPLLDKSAELYALPSTGVFEKFPSVWKLGRWPYVITAKAKDIGNDCAENSGVLPTASSEDLPDLAKLVKFANVTTQIVSLSWKANSMSYPNDVRAISLTSLFETTGSLKSDALKEVVSRHESIYYVDPVSETVSNMPKEKWDTKIKSICMVAINRYSKYLQSPTDFKAKASKMVRKLDMLHTFIENYWDRLKLTPLDLSQSNEGKEVEGYPIMLGEIQEFLGILDSCFSLQQCNLFDENVFAKIDALLQKISFSITKIELGFLITNEGTCQISSGLKLSCLCSDFTKTWSKLIFEPISISKQILAFDHILYQHEGGKPLAETCIYEANSRHYILTEHCCELVLAVDANAIYHCPSYFLENFSGVTLDHKLLRVDATEQMSINKKCEQVSDSKTIIGADSLMLSSCNLEVLSKIGRYVWKGFENFFVEKSLGENEEKMSTREIIIFSSLGVMGFLLIVLVTGIIFYCSKKSSKMSCLCFERQDRVLEPLQLPEAIPLHSYETRNLENRPSIAYR